MGGLPGEFTIVANAEPGPNTIQIFKDGILQVTQDGNATQCATPICNTATTERGGPDGDFCLILDGGNVVLDYSATPIIVDGNTGDFEVILYERYNGGIVYMDWIMLEISTDGITWVTIFNWSDGIDDANSSLIPTYAGSGEPDNYGIPAAAPLVGNPFTTGIMIDADAVAPLGTYMFVRISSPLGGSGNAAELDSIEVLP